MTASRGNIFRINGSTRGQTSKTFVYSDQFLASISAFAAGLDRESIRNNLDRESINDEQHANARRRSNEPV
jgi:hypothetical protein